MIFAKSIELIQYFIDNRSIDTGTEKIFFNAIKNIQFNSNSIYRFATKKVDVKRKWHFTQWAEKPNDVLLCSRVASATINDIKY